MNVLMYVMTILMLLSALTYARLESFRSFAGLEASFKHFMNSTERLPLDRMNLKMYDSIKVLSKTSTDRTPPNAGTSRLSFYTLLKKESREQNPDAYQQTRELAKVLMTNLYGDQRFFQELAEKRPTFLNDILDEIQQASEKQESLRLKNATVLSKLEFTNSELQYTFYLMLHGLPSLEEQTQIEETKKIGLSIVFSPPNEKEDAEEENAAKMESEEAKAPPGYASFINYITVKPTTKIRVYLASKALLTSIYGNADIAQSIIEARHELYNQVNSGLKLEQATEQFRNAFAQSGNAHNFSAILDFSVTKTNPQKYE